jgi:hypothetical protein
LIKERPSLILVFGPAIREGEGVYPGVESIICRVAPDAVMLTADLTRLEQIRRAVTLVEVVRDLAFGERRLLAGLSAASRCGDGDFLAELVRHKFLDLLVLKRVGQR